jgi:WD40 repeat protein
MTIPESPGLGRKPWRWAAIALGLIGLAGASTWWSLGRSSPKPWRLSVALNTFYDDGEVAYSPDGRTIATPGIRMIPPFARDFPKGLIPEYGASQGIVELREAATGAKLKDLGFDPLHGATSVRPIVFSPDGTLVVAGDSSEHGSHSTPLLKVWDVASGRLIATLELPTGSPREVTFSGDGRIFLALTETQAGWPTPFRVLRWETATWTPIEGMTIPLKGVYATALAPGGELLAATQLGENPVILIEIPTGRERARIAPPIPPNVIAPSGNFRFSPDGRTLVAAGPLGEVELLDVPTGTVRALIPRDKDRLGSSPEIAFSPDGRTLALGDTYLPAEGEGTRLVRALYSSIGVDMPQPTIVGRVTFVDVATGRRQSGFDGVQSRLTRLTFSPDGRTLVTDGDPPAVAAAGLVVTAEVATVAAGPDNPRTLIFWDVPVFPLK